MGIYARISDDQAGEALGVARQCDDCRALAGVKRWPVGREYVDNSVSAYKRGVRRPEFERLLADLESGILGGMLVYDLDRLARQPRDLERLLDVYDRDPSLTFATVTGDINLGTADGRVMARVMVAFANKSSHDTGRRVKRKHREQAELGVPVGGRRPFGYRDDKRTIDPTEAEAIRKGADMILAGAGVNSVVAMWNDAGLKTPAGNRWVRQAVRNVYLNPRIAGYRSTGQKGPSGKPNGLMEMVRTADGEPVRGQWEPVLPLTEWEAVTEVINARKGSAGPTRRYLLSGIARCGVCGSKMRAQVPAKKKDGTTSGGEGNFYYACESKANGGCNGVSISGPNTDALVSEYVIRLSESVEVEEADAPTWERQAELDQVTADIRDLTAEWRGKRISTARFTALLSELEQAEAGLRAERGRVEAAQRRQAAEAVDLRRDWPSMDVQRKREFVSRFLSAVMIHKSERRLGRAFDTERVEPVERDRD